jgi:transcriptional regulator with XRE-family HTH domain
MNTEPIGGVIARLRKEKGSTQEELAKYVLVSTQAVSKWENGGVPDTDLLPKIADFFGVSIDTLFGRSLTDYSDLEHALAKKLADTPRKERFETAFELCWVIERAMFGEEISKDGSIEVIRNKEGTIAFTRAYAATMALR